VPSLRREHTLEETLEALTSDRGGKARQSLQRVAVEAIERVAGVPDVARWVQPAQYSMLWRALRPADPLCERENISQMCGHRSQAC